MEQARDHTGHPACQGSGQDGRHRVHILHQQGNGYGRPQGEGPFHGQIRNIQHPEGNVDTQGQERPQKTLGNGWQ